MQEIWYASLGELRRSDWKQEWRHFSGLKHPLVTIFAE